MTRNTPSRSLHDLGLAAWFGGTLANAVALNSASAEADAAADRGAVANAGWDRWTPVNAVAIGAHVVGSLGQIRGNTARIHGQKGVPSMVVGKTPLTAAALGVTAYSRVLGRTVDSHHDVPVASGTQPVASTPPEVAAAQKKLAKLPRNSSPVRIKNRCSLSGRPRAYIRKYGVSRIQFRELALAGKIPGVTKSSW